MAIPSPLVPIGASAAPAIPESGYKRRNQTFVLWPRGHGSNIDLLIHSETGSLYPTSSRRYGWGGCCEAHSVQQILPSALSLNETSTPRLRVPSGSTQVSREAICRSHEARCSGSCLTAGMVAAAKKNVASEYGGLGAAWHPLVRSIALRRIGDGWLELCGPFGEPRMQSITHKHHLL